MKILHKWIILACLLLASLISYGYGFTQAVTFFVAVGVALELAFWFGIFSKQQSSEHSRN